MTTPTVIQFEGGDILAAAEPLTITGLLLPYNEVGRTNVGRFQVEAGAVTIPTDPAVVGANLDHVRHDVVGRAVRLEEKPEGVFASIRFADTEEGRAAYADAISPSGKRRKLSAEFGPAVIKAGKLVSGHAKLWGAALVEAGAFPSAMVLAADTPDEVPPADGAPAAAEPTETTETVTDEFTDENGVTRKRTVTTTTRTEPDGEGGTKTTITEKTVIEEPDANAPADEEEESPVGVPVSALATAPGTATPKVDLQQVYAAISTLRTNPHDQAATQVLAALTDITIGGANALPAAGVLRENWLGQLFQGIPYERQYITLGQLGTDISAAGKKGFKVRRGTSASPVDSFAGIADWAGNKTEIASGNGFTQTAGSILHRFAFGNDIGREFYDLPGGAEVVEAFLKLIAEDYLVWSDEKARRAWIAAAGAPIALGTYPTQYNGAIGQLLQGILVVKKKKTDNRADKPSFVIANDKAYESLVYTPKDLLPEFVKLSVTTDREGLVDGDVLVINGDNGIIDTPAVTVGAKYAIEFDELGSTPLLVDALELAKGGIDKAHHGYVQEFQVRPEAVRTIGVADSRANSAPYAVGRVLSQGGTVYRVTAAGTSGGSAPTAPAVGATVTDGTATLLRVA